MLLKDMLPARAAPATNRAIAATARVLGSFVAGTQQNSSLSKKFVLPPFVVLFIGNSCGKDRDMLRKGFISSGVNGGFALRATGSGVIIGRATVQEKRSIV